jgi:BirA family biotin operon repressor/biotin-[acetyl-CoA-carboxylase] ligase
MGRQQTSGRGRMGRTWFTPPDSALAFSLILRPGPGEQENIGRFAALGALALVNMLSTLGVTAQIKWPNDVLINRRKVAGILIETVWSGDEVDSLVLGMGVNVLPASLPPAPGLNFPVTCIQSETPAVLVREILLMDILMNQSRSGRAAPRRCVASCWGSGPMARCWSRPRLVKSARLISEKFIFDRCDIL